MTAVPRRGIVPFQGRDSGPVRAKCEVLASRRFGRYWSLTFVAPEIAERSEPGQFISVGVAGAGTLLRRPFSIYDVSQHGAWAGTVEIVFDVVGQGTRWLSERAKHDVVDLVGPLGRAFPLPAQRVPCLLVGGGYGAAPLLYLAKVLAYQGLRADMIMGGKDQSAILNAIEAKRICATAQFTTEDGSLGERGVVTDLMDKVADAAGSGVVYACGSMPMLRAVTAKAMERQLPVQVAVEESMACGTGVCMTCVLPVERSGGVRNVRACTEGPVLNGAKIRWDLLGRPIPTDGAVSR